MTDLSARYGTRKSRRGVLQVVAAVVITALAAWAVWMVVYQANPEVRSDLSRFELGDEYKITATVNVIRDEPDRAASCEIRALAHDHAVVGFESFDVTSGPEKQTLQIEIRTERAASSVELLGCFTKDQSQRK